MRARLAALLAAACAATGSTALGEQLVQWDFNSSNTNATFFNSNFLATPSLSLVGGATGGFAGASGSSDETQPGQGFNTTSYPAITSANKTAGVQFNFNTTNFDIDVFRFDWRTSNTSSRYMQVQYTLDGSSWLDGTTFTSTGGDAWNNQLAFNVSSIAGADNNASFGIRLVSMFSPVGFTQSTGPQTTYGPDQAYRAANTDDRAYAGTGTWRFDMVTLEGSFVPITFTPTNLTWNAGSGNWDTNGANTPWLNPSAVASSFNQAGGQGDVVTFNNPAPNSVITVQASGVTPNSTTISNNATLTFTGGSIGGTGGLVKNGTGRLILVASNTFTSANGPTEINAGVVETRAGSGLGSGTVSIGNATWHSTTSPQNSPGLVNLTGPVTFQADADLAIGGGLAGSGAITKTGAATLGIGGISSNVGAININAGALRMDAMGALGGLGFFTPTPAININNATLVVNATGNNPSLRTRLSDDITLNNGVISRNQLTIGLGADPTNGDSEFTAYTESGSGGKLIVSGNSTIANLETRTAAASATPGGGGNNNVMVVRMPVNITPGSTLNLFAANGTLSTVGGQLTGNLGNTAVALRSPDTAVNPNDSVTLGEGATINMIGPGEKRIGSSNQGKPIIGRGTSTNESTIKADGRTYLTAKADIENINTIFVVAGSGTGGLRVEAPMNSNYSGQIPTAGFFGTNPDGSEESLGNIYTIMAPVRYAGLSTGGPTVGADNLAVTRGGVLTLAASDAAGATGLIDNGPAGGTVVRLGIDNTTTSGALVYQIDPAANVGAFANFGGLVLKRTGADNVTTRLLGDATLTGANAANTSLEQLGGTLDLNTRRLTVGVATLSAGGIVGGGTISAASVSKVTSGVVTAGPGVRFDTPSLNVSAGTLALALDGSAASVSRVGAMTISAGAVLDLNDNDLLIGAGSSAAVQQLVRSARNTGAWDGAGLTSSAARTASPQNKTLGVLSGAEYLSVAGATFNNYAVTSGNVLVKFTYYGDTDFNGQINFDDYSRIDAGFLNQRTGWLNGDFNYDDVVNFDDYALIDGAFLSQSGTLRPALEWLGGDGGIDMSADPSLRSVQMHFAQFGSDYANALVSAVPEPASAGMMIAAIALGLNRRSRRRG